ncbi:hypothetical protein [Parafrankia sp. BMG5.11]|uniref:hypothetical protein n=2 Tax=unclassified Parafrankia TaxID=2994368 RepID=UPI000DA5D038|nr:hypothetical protein [Parafrankia sp. BMG5.11]TCJ36270.1 hypothetical protein E0504_25075 [Parafrankia sp. BMG5.11]SQD98256.1 conserved exported hypothetical protein [Parafrankia sp. Ea1.12]
MRKGMGRSAALLAMSSAATVILSFGPGLTAAHADIFDDKGRCDDKKSEEWDIFGDKDRDDKDREGDKEARAFVDDKDAVKDDRDKDDRDKDDDWFDDKDKDRDCPVGVVAGAGVGVGAGAGGAPVGGVGAGGGGTADSGNSPLLPIAGAGLGAILIGAGMRRRGHGSI